MKKLISFRVRRRESFKPSNSGGGAIDKNIEILIFGLGHGTRIIDGNYLYYSEMTDSPRLLINSQYDVEVGYLHLLARFGILYMYFISLNS